VTLHPLAERFALVADAYERGRPDYAPAVIGALTAELHVAPGARVLDLGAGTGKLTRALLAFGLDAVAVEPQAPLRELLARAIGPERALDGLAEEVPLPNDSVALVTVADAFHWFDQGRALAEVKRVLAPGGGFAVFSTAPNLSGTDWATELGAMVESSRPAHPFFDGPPWQQAAREAGGFDEPFTVRVSYEQQMDGARVLDWLASFSWVAALPEDDRATLMERAGGFLGDAESETVPMQVTIGMAALADGAGSV
jgi:SAM-dependent methyltransferase